VHVIDSEEEGNQDYQLQLAIQNDTGFESQNGEGVHVIDLEEESDEDYQIQLVIQHSLRFESQNGRERMRGLEDMMRLRFQDNRVSFSNDEMQESTQADLDMQAQQAAERELQWKREEAEIIEQVRAPPHLFLFLVHYSCARGAGRHVPDTNTVP
jgi:hypothetical protein